ncbi:MMPL family transporter [Candidatus Solincola tengchongensis]|uniref:efflux RND transporter permease subunit n=1 Tax=Candidatus Solincola tengchongensis TaxID=2900693 RepID=UPI00257EAAF7|nr:MMPL family transporter [Candidatus Solincola tengchongensis]
MVEKVFRGLANQSEKRPVLVILVILAITALALAGFRFIKSEYSYKAMLPKDLESVKALEEAEDIFGGTIEEQVMLEGDVLRGDVLRRVAGYKSFLRENPDVWETFVTDVVTPLDEMNLFVDAGGGNYQPTEQYLLENLDKLSDDELVAQVRLNIAAAAERARALGVPGAGIRGISQDEKALLLTARINPEKDTMDQIKLVDPFEAYTREYFGDLAGVNLYESGNASLNRDANQQTMKETRFLFALAFAFILVVLFLTFRRFSDVLLTLMVIMVTIIWVMGLSGWLGFPFTYQSTAIMPLLLGIDIAYAIHVMSRYYEERRGGNDPYASSTKAVVTTGVAVFLTAATTAFGFASFSISDMPPIVQFGILCVAGVLFSFLLSVTLLPATVVLRDRSPKAQEKWERKNRRRAEKSGATWLDQLLSRVAVLSEHHRVLVGIVTFLVLATCGILAFNISTEADLSRMMKGDTPSMRASELINQYFGGQNIGYALVEGDILEPDNLEAMLDFENRISSTGLLDRDGNPLIERSRVMSIADVVRNVGGGAIPASKQEVISMLMKLRGNGQNSGMRLISEDGRVAMISVRVARGSQSDMENIANIMREAGREVMEENPSVRMAFSGLPILMSDLLASIVPTQLKTSGLALLLCALIVILVFKSVFLGLAATSVVFLGIALEIGALVILGWPLDFMTVMISSLVIGAGIDFGIHVTHRFREEWHGGMEVDEAIRRTVGHVGKALVAAAATTAGAFAIIALSDVTPLRRFGGITALSLTFALLASLLVLPSILAWYANLVERRGKRQVA